VVAYVGRLDTHKGILEFLHAAGKIAASNGQVAFLLIGGPVGAQNADWAQIGPALDSARAAGGTVHITGFTDQPYGYMQRADVLVLPSHDEGFPRAVLEAMALRKPIVATAVGGVPEAITNEEQGLLIPARDSASLTQAITRLVNDSELRNALGSAALSRVARDFSVDVTTETVLRVLHSAVAA
jgi:glycosyltransferase involved in cell wall biosynthesis